MPVQQKRRKKEDKCSVSNYFDKNPVSKINLFIHIYMFLFYQWEWDMCCLDFVC